MEQLILDAAVPVVLRGRAASASRGEAAGAHIRPLPVAATKHREA